MTLSASQLLDTVLSAISSSGWRSIVISQKKPFEIRIYNDESRGKDLRIYIWNCTHGGGSARAKNEYRVQLTSVVPSTHPGQVTLILGWHAGYEVFVAFDIRKHEGQDSSSPSIQIKEETLQAAHLNAFSIYERGNGEIAVAFRPEFLVEYALNSEGLHLFGAKHPAFSLLNDLDEVDSYEVDQIKDRKRRVIVSRIARRYRAYDFCKRVLVAYSHRCAFCGVQLKLVDAAHIIPVAADSSTDETRNGIALCKIHHAAYDQNLVSFNEAYKIEISNYAVARLATERKVLGLTEFRARLRPIIFLPADRRDYPPLLFIKESRNVRGWKP